MNEERMYTESEVKAIVKVERAEARYQAMREILDLVSSRGNVELTTAN